MKRFIIFYLFIIVAITLFPKQHNKTSNTNVTTEHAAVVVQESCRFSINKIACSFTLKNQFGKNIKLHDLIGKVVVLDFSTMWCYPCNVAAMSSRDIQKKYGDDIAYITIIAQDEEGK